MSTIAAVLVTHNAEDWIAGTLDSIDAQSRRLDDVVVIDDGSSDATVEILKSRGIIPTAATTTASDAVTRIAANFVQGVLACSSYDLVVLGDHDDIWHPERTAHQAALLGLRLDALMVASDGVIVDGAGSAIGGTVRESFPVTADWDSLSPADRMRFALRFSIATGGASMIRPAAFPTLTVPRGWLHDRWWSLVATARDGMVIDPRAVIDYRVREGQQVGLDAAAQQHGPLGRLAALAGQARRSMGKQGDLRRILRPMAIDDEVAAAVSLRSVL